MRRFFHLRQGLAHLQTWLATDEHKGDVFFDAAEVLAFKCFIEPFICLVPTPIFIQNLGQKN